MVGSINAPTNGSNTHEAYVAAAKAVGGSEVTVSALFCTADLLNINVTTCRFVGSG